MQLFIMHSGSFNRLGRVVVQGLHFIAHFSSVSPKALSNSKVERVESALTKQINPTHFRGASFVANATSLAPLQWAAYLRRYVPRV